LGKDKMVGKSVPESHPMRLSPNLFKVSEDGYVGASFEEHVEGDN
jgi:hypothetical protein